MDRATLLTKKQILAGASEVVTVAIPSLGGSVEIRPLTGGQWARIEATRTRGISMSIDSIPPEAMEGSPEERKAAMKNTSGLKMNMDLEAVTEAEFEADALACSYGMAGNWSLPEVKSIRPAAAIREIAAEIYKLSEVEPEDLQAIAAFREDA